MTQRDIRTGFAAASNAFVRTVRVIDPEQWDLPHALGSWTVRELVAHTLRAYTTIESYLADAVAPGAVVMDAAAYWRAGVATPNVHEAVAERGRAAGRELVDPVNQVEEVATRLAELIPTVDDDRLLATRFGAVPFVEYLATRTLELAAHTLDIQSATGQPPDLPEAAAGVVIPLLTSLVDPVVLVRALLGRRPLPPGFNVLA